MSKVICVVDDQSSLRQMLRFALNMNGLQVLEADNGCNAFDILSAQHVDLLIVDWQMPGMNGLEFVRRVRENGDYADMPIIMVSCLDDLPARMEAFELKVITWLKKPFRISEIQEIVGRVLNPAPQTETNRPGRGADPV